MRTQHLCKGRLFPCPLSQESVPQVNLSTKKQLLPHCTCHNYNCRLWNSKKLFAEFKSGLLCCLECFIRKKGQCLLGKTLIPLALHSLWIHDLNFLNLDVTVWLPITNLKKKKKKKKHNFLTLTVWTWQCPQFKADSPIKANMDNRNPLVTLWHELSLNWLKLISQRFLFLYFGLIPLLNMRFHTFAVKWNHLLMVVLHIWLQ